MFVVFDRIDGGPLIVNVKDDDGRVLAEKAVILCSTEEGARKVLRKVFGKDEAWNSTRFAILDGRKQPNGPKVALQQLVDFTGLSLFLDENYEVHNAKDILE